jgi:acyl carrier protein
MTSDEALRVIREHLSDELGIDPHEITKESRFKEDLDADSLDLYTLVQELDDAYGVKMTDEQAAAITTVGEAVAFVVDQTGGENE